MIKHPVVRAIMASVYIIVVVLMMQYIMKEGADKPDTILAPIAMLSLLVLSVATMAYIFFAEPIYLYLDGNKKKAFTFLIQTIISFAVITMVTFVVAILFSQYISLS